MKVINTSNIYKKNNRLWIDIFFVRAEEVEKIQFVKLESSKKWKLQPTLKTFTTQELNMIKNYFRNRRKQA